MKTSLNFEQHETKVLLSKLNFEFFLKQNIEKEKYRKHDVDEIYKNYRYTMKYLKVKAKENRKQFNYYVEGQVRKMFLGGLLPAHFELDESRENRILDFHATGENWAYFEHWQSYQKRKLTKEKIWNVVVKCGSILGIILGFIKLFEYLTH